MTIASSFVKCEGSNIGVLEPLHTKRGGVTDPAPTFNVSVSAAYWLLPLPEALPVEDPLPLALLPVPVDPVAPVEPEVPDPVLPLIVPEAPVEELPLRLLELPVPAVPAAPALVPLEPLTLLPVPLEPLMLVSVLPLPLTDPPAVLGLDAAPPTSLLVPALVPLPTLMEPEAAPVRVVLTVMSGLKVPSGAHVFTTKSGKCAGSG